MNYNRVILVGRLTRDPELRYTTNGTAVASFSLAINRRFNREETDFIDVVAWRQQAEYCANLVARAA
jgi:single-strand DNA-binding protein